MTLAHGDPNGRVLNGRYRLVRELGRGGMAAIWEAHDGALDRRVALKLLHPQFARDPEFLERFRREARAAAGLAHPNIVGIYDVAQDLESGTPFLVLELVDGESLKDLLRRTGALPEARVRAIGGAIAEALEYAHRRGVVHRDVKPQNVLVAAEDGRPRLTDFGIAQAMSDTSLTRTGAVMGSVHYLAPELARGRPATPAADVYSLGVMLYELATGRLPFSGDTDMAIALAHVEQEPPPPGALNPRISPALQAVILRALAKDPAQRFASAGEMAQALRAAVSTQTTRVVPPVPQRPAATTGQTRTVAVPTVAGAGMAPPPPRRRTAPRQRQPGGMGGGGVLALLLVLAVVLIALGIGFFGLASFTREGLFAAPRPAPTATRAAPTATPAPAAQPSPTPAPVAASTTAPTPTAVPPTATAAPPSPTPVPPTPTAPPPTATPAPPTATPRPATTPTPQRVAAPRLVGLKVDDATAALRAAGLVAVIRPGNVNAERDTVWAQTPDPGIPLAPGSTVTLTVATGQVPVPEVAGRPEEEAVRTLAAAGVRVGEITRRPDNRVPAGAAIRTQPDAGTVVPRGSVVDLVLSRG